MMSIIAINAGHRKGGRRASRILDQYLPRVGIQAWAGYLSKEGCDAVMSELREQASRTTAVQILWQHDHHHEVIATIGHAARFNDMLTSIGKASSHGKPRPIPVFVRRVILMARAAGHWHDTGKILDEFQATVRGQGKPVPHPIRHQTMSYYILRDVLALPLAGEWREIQCAQGGAWNEGSLSMEQSIVGATVLTHHAKTTRDGSPNRFYLTTDRGFGTWEGSKERRIDLGQIGGVWLDAARASLRRVAADTDTIAPENHALAFYATRLSMILADHAVSSHEKTENYDGRADSRAQDDVVYAKSEPFIPLADHLAHVASEASHAAHALFMHAWPRLKRRPESMMRSVPDHFRWQEHAESAIRQAGVAEHDGFFGAIIAETGSGKTQGGFRIMSALGGGSPRFTLGLGLGALAIQSGIEYYSEIGLGLDEVAIVVGHRHKLALEEGKRGLGVGKQSPDDRYDIVFDIEGSTGTDDHALPTVFSRGMGKFRKMLTTPIVVMTIDHIMAAMQADRGGYVTGAARAVTSDLLIDEIDSFSPSDLHAISRLIYLVASFGRKVVVSSATLTPELGHMLSEAYKAGYAKYQSAMRGGRLFAGVFANTGSMARVVTEDDDGFRQSFAQVAGSVKEHLDHTSHRRRMDVLEMTGITDEDALFEHVGRRVMDLAKTHHVNLPAWQGAWLSTGFVRFNMIKHAQRFALWMTRHAHELEQEHGVRIRLNCYTSALDSMTRKSIEQDVGRLTNRKNDDWADIPKIRDLGKEPVPTVFILVTSPVIEVGRDFDFDWCVLDPSSDISIIQSSGRVLRHRRLVVPKEPNVVMLGGSVRGILGEKGDPYGFPGPGFQQPNPLHGDWTDRWRMLRSKQAAEIFGADIYADGVHSGYRLTSSVTVADRIDRETTHHVLTGHLAHGKGGDKCLRAFLDLENPWRDDFFDAIQFRNKDDQSTLELQYQNGAWMPNDAIYQPVSDNRVDVDTSRLLFFYPLVNGTSIHAQENALNMIKFSPHLGVLRYSDGSAA